MIRFRITRNVILNKKSRFLNSYSMYTIVAKLPQKGNTFISAYTGYIVLEKLKI